MELQIKNYDNYAFAKDGKIFNGVFGFELDTYNRIWVRARTGLIILQNETSTTLSINGTPFENTGIKRMLLHDSTLWITGKFDLCRLTVTETISDLRKLEKVTRLATFGIDADVLIPDNGGLWICSTTRLFFYGDF